MHKLIPNMFETFLFSYVTTWVVQQVMTHQKVAKKALTVQHKLSSMGSLRDPELQFLHRDAQ